MDDRSKMLGRLPVRGFAGFRVVLDEDGGAVPLALGDHAEVEAGVEEFGRGELP